jgi:5-methylcytosine-specific restriction endonuclease McrA
MKRCIKCNELKPFSEFHKDKYAKDKHTSKCAECCKKYDDQYRKNHRKQISDRYKLYYRTVRKKRNENCKKLYGVGLETIYRYGLELVLKVYKRDDHKCRCCGSKIDLTIHHKDRNGYYNPKKGKPMNNKLSNLIILCRSCHGREHSLDRFVNAA